ncbi:hypothetical protein OH76DRAFT_1490233 [Lentinus brumalis]|uniref:Uncharacterized protein n=1 Tax=Lentinus brumalis TaxID=2498619 RepID=A0A371CJR1_9APHY|nr:hypothetical protein OH76DRAFT_1490233 [Polyporus brumalis]
MNAANLPFEPLVVLSTRAATVTLDHITQLGIPANEATEPRYVHIPVLEFAPNFYSLIAFPVDNPVIESFGRRPLPAYIMLNFWDLRICTSLYETRSDVEGLPRGRFFLTDHNAQCQYIFAFLEAHDYATCMFYFFATRRVVLARERAIGRLQAEGAW